MHYVFRMSALFALTLICVGNTTAAAQEESSDISQVEVEKIEAWAEKHSQEWESWAERFESKMERWAETQEKSMGKWGDTYTKRWEEWAAKMESGDFDADEMNALMEQNLKLIKEMPLGEMLESGLQEGLKELKNAPFDSLGELHDLIGGSLEKSLRSMEIELKGKLPKDLKANLKALESGELQKALLKLQKSIDVKSKNLDKNAAVKIKQVEKLLKQKLDLAPGIEAKIVAAMERELVDAESALQAIARQKQRASGAEGKKAQLAAEFMAKRQTALEKSKKAMKASEKYLARYYEDLKRTKSELNTTETEIESMRREIEMLRKEVKSLKKNK